MKLLGGKKFHNLTYCFPFSSSGLSIEQIMLKDLKELTDGEIKVAISTVNMTLEVRERMLSGNDGISTMVSEHLGYRAPHH